jgi:hypothetical protein
MLERELSHLSSDNRLINSSFDSTTTAIREQIGLAADQQRAGKEIPAEKIQQIEKLYFRLEVDKKRLATMVKKESKIRARYDVDLERFRFITREDEPETGPEKDPETDQG